MSKAKMVRGVSYRAEAPIRELFISVRSTHTGTTLSLTYAVRTKGDLPAQGNRWVLQESSPKEAVTLLHMTNLAAWLVRQAIAGRWRKVR